jgi:hypothetical protein
VGNEKFPCKFTGSLDAPIPLPMSGVEFTLSGALELGFCNDYSGIDYVMGTVSVSVAPSFAGDIPIPFGECALYVLYTVFILCLYCVLWIGPVCCVV